MQRVFWSCVVVLSALFVHFAWLTPRVALPEHLLHHAAVFRENFISEETRVELLNVLKSLGSIPTNAEDLKHYKTLHESIGEETAFDGVACPHPLLIPNVNRTRCIFPSRLDVARHFIVSGGHEGLKERYEVLVGRILSFGVYLFDLNKYPVLKGLFDSENFRRGSVAVCPPDRQFLDPFQFNFIINTPGQTVAHHIDGVYFWGATRFQIPQWLLAAMKFSGFFEEQFVHQVQTVAYLHNWTDDREGKFVFYTDNDKVRSMEPLPRSANVVDGSKIVHAATVYRSNASMPQLKPSDKNTLDYEGNDTWIMRSNGADRVRLTTDDLRISIVYRARCFRDESEAEKFRSLSTFMSLESILNVFERDLVRRGLMSGKVSPFELGMLILKTYVSYPLAPRDVALIPYNYCALPRLIPALAPIFGLVC